MKYIAGISGSNDATDIYRLLGQAAGENLMRTIENALTDRERTFYLDIGNRHISTGKGSIKGASVRCELNLGSRDEDVHYLRIFENTGRPCEKGDMTTVYELAFRHPKDVGVKTYKEREMTGQDLSAIAFGGSEAKSIIDRASPKTIINAGEKLENMTLIGSRIKDICAPSGYSLEGLNSVYESKFAPLRASAEGLIDRVV